MSNQINGTLIHCFYTVFLNTFPFVSLFRSVIWMLLENQFYLFCWFLDVSVRKKRKKHGGSGRKLFTEGWIEFKDKCIAKAVAQNLNNTPIGNCLEVVTNWSALGIVIARSKRRFKGNAIRKSLDGGLDGVAKCLRDPLLFLEHKYSILLSYTKVLSPMSDKRIGEVLIKFFLNIIY